VLGDAVGGGAEQVVAQEVALAAEDDQVGLGFAGDADDQLGGMAGAELDLELDAGRHDLRHTFATFALRAGISTFDLSRYMGTSLAMIDRHYGHLARDGREHAIRLLDIYSGGELPDVHPVDAAWTPNASGHANGENGKGG
jgi:hypothetical protein